MDNQPRNIWITGGGSGIGKQLSLLYAASGHRVIISGRNRQRLQAVAATYPDHIRVLPFDVTDVQAIEDVQHQLAGHADHLDLLILNAGTAEYIQPPALDPGIFRRVMDTNFMGLVHSLEAARPLLDAAPTKPHVVGICSLASFIGFPRAEAYGASKAAANYLLDSLRTDFGHCFDITVVNPGFIHTPLTANNRFPMPFVMSAERAAGIIARRIRRRPRVVNFPRRLTALLRLARGLPGLWYWRMKPRRPRPGSDRQRKPQ